MLYCDEGSYLHVSFYSSTLFFYTADSITQYRFRNAELIVFDIDDTAEYS